MSEAFICEAVRTPIGRYGGNLATVRIDDLAALPIQTLLDRHPQLLGAVTEVYLGCANQSGEDNRNVARMATLLTALGETTPAVTFNRLCASGMDAVGAAARAIATGEADVIIAGGVESMTRAPLVMAKAETAFSRSAELFDTTLGWRFVNPRIEREYGVDTLAATGEFVAQEHHVSRADQDAFAVRSQSRAARAKQAGLFARQIVPVAVPGGRKGEAVLVQDDEHPRPGTTLEALAKLKPIVHEQGTITAGNASGINDGACAMIVASAAAVARLGLKPRARVLGMASAGVPPRTMGMGPVPATHKLMARLGLSIGDFDAIELNEAFASQALACLRALKLPDDAEHVNANGGAIALGHPLGMSGARIVDAAVTEMVNRGGKRGLATLCVGVGQGVSLALERV
jgi:3-oxoadipyl-CoA thiolase